MISMAAAGGRISSLSFDRDGKILAAGCPNGIVTRCHLFEKVACTH